MLGILLLLVLVVILFGAVALLYNRLVRYRNRIDNSWAQVDVQLRRRYDLIPNVIEAVKAYAAHERGTFTEVVEARQVAVEARTVEEQGPAEDALTGALRRLFALAENYPALRASENFTALQKQLAETENRVAVARQIYNDSVLRYNNAVQTVPSNMVASAFGFAARGYFEIADEIRSVPQVAS